MIYKKIEIEEMEHFWSLLNALDAETNFMMYEPNERKQHMDIQELETVKREGLPIKIFILNNRVLGKISETQHCKGRQ